ncbi:MAG: hypothetical protein HXK96_01015 [Candidatus Nanogingivalaceae bacterium]|jgi:hypothetical protein|nr:hypothetical protein [Candidatus Nanogingivalaceae bacterium]MBF1015388.1 hypothetical protein [Candidatus Nanogingivalaceae bacterium]QTI96221.1 MAG: hypothetical protein HXK94_003095 [Candidatus Nanogingivalaceae bacterium]QWB91532.1 MAG: hypothetical protein HXK95_003100 [Candidatus Nanogingivalaceae bacterium]
MMNKTTLYNSWLDSLKESLDNQDAEKAQIIASKISTELHSDYDKNSPISIIGLNEIADYIISHLLNSPNDKQSYDEIVKFYNELKS